MLSFLRSLLKLNHRVALEPVRKLREERNDPDKASRHPVGYKVVPPPPTPPQE